MANTHNNAIPKTIHYCWFGNNPVPENLQTCIDSWNKLEGYKIVKWDESNCNFDENDFIKKAYAEKKWQYISDYYRLKALYDYGGIYLDTDVEIFNDFEPLLSNNVFLGFNYNCCVGTAVIGSIPRSPFIKSIISLYDNTYFGETTNNKRFQFDDACNVILTDYTTNNYYFTAYILKNYPNFQLNNTYQNLGDFSIYPKEMFEIGYWNKSQYTIHHNTGTWKTNNNPTKNFKNLLKKIIASYKAELIARKLRYYKANKKLPFYEQYICQKKGKPTLDINE